MPLTYVPIPDPISYYGHLDIITSLQPTSTTAHPVITVDLYNGPICLLV